MLARQTPESIQVAVRRVDSVCAVGGPVVGAVEDLEAGALEESLGQPAVCAEFDADVFGQHIAVQPIDARRETNGELISLAWPTQHPRPA
jgi:hypothetical protein